MAYEWNYINDSSMKQWLILISIDMWQYHKSTFWCTHNRLKIRMCKIMVSSLLSLVVNGEIHRIHKDPNKVNFDVLFMWKQSWIELKLNWGEVRFCFQMLSQETAATSYSLGFICTPLDFWSVKPHTTGLNFLSILSKQCTILNPTQWYLNISLDQTHPFLKGFYYVPEPKRSIRNKLQRWDLFDHK